VYPLRRKGFRVGNSRKKAGSFGHFTTSCGHQLCPQFGHSMSTTLRLEIGGGDMEKKYGRSLKDTHIVEDPMTGEVLEVSERIRGSFSPYVMVFDQGMKALASLKDAPHGLVMAVIHRMSYANNCQRVELPVAVQKEIAAAYGVSDRTLRRLVSSMEQDGILLREGRGVYQVNPFYFGKGSMTSIMWFRKNFGTVK